MFVTEDPYGTNTTSLYVYFTTDDAVAVSYTVHADAIRISPVTPIRNRNTAKPTNSLKAKQISVIPDLLIPTAMYNIMKVMVMRTVN